MSQFSPDTTYYTDARQTHCKNNFGNWAKLAIIHSAEDERAIDASRKHGYCGWIGISDGDDDGMFIFIVHCLYNIFTVEECIL